MNKPTKLEAKPAPAPTRAERLLSAYKGEQLDVAKGLLDANPKMTKAQLEKAVTTAAHFPDDAELEGVIDYDRPDLTKTDFIRPGYQARHVVEKRVKDRERQGWVIDQGQKSHLPGHVLMQLPDKAVASHKARVERQAALNEASVKAPERVGPNAFEHKKKE